MTEMHKNDLGHGDEEPFIRDFDSINSNFKFCCQPKLKPIFAVGATDAVLPNAQDLNMA